MRRFTTSLLLCLLATPALAQTPGDCEHGTAQADLDESGVFARLFNNGNLFYGNDTTSRDGYVVPKLSGHSPLFAANVWVGGLLGGDLRVAGATYDRFEFWPGPLNEGATLPDPDDCSDFDRIWVVSAADVAHYEQTGYATADLAEWPVELGAEVIDGDGVEGNYDLEAGDRPRLFGSQTAFWVMNDVGNEHAYSESLPIGLEVQVTAFVIASEEPAFDQATFYRYRLINRNTLPLEEARFGFWQDPYVGNGSTDYPAVDTTRGLAYTYSAYEEVNDYGTPPAFGVDFLDDGLEVGMTFWDCCPPTVDPADAAGMYFVLRGQWTDGTPITEGGDGYQTDGAATTTMFPGDPVSGAFWSHENVDGNGTAAFPGDRHTLAASPAFSLAPGETRDVHLALVFAQGTDRLDSVTELRAASDAVQDAFDSGMLFPVASEGEATSLSASGLHSVYPNPLRGTATVRVLLREASEISVVVYDMLGREVAVLHAGPLGAGEHALAFETAGLPAAVYLVRAEGEDFTAARRVTVVR